MALTLLKFVLIYWLLSYLEPATTTTTPYEMTWSTDVFGPDGPWQAIQVSIGNPGQNVSLYPGGLFYSSVFSPSVCTNITLGSVCYAQQAGLYNYSESSTAVYGSISFKSSIDFTSGALELDGQRPISTLDQISLKPNEAIIPNISIALYDSVFGTLPNGTYYPISVGSLALGAPDTVNQTFDKTDGTPSINASTISGWLWSYVRTDNQFTPSNSFGLHIGAVTPKVAPSLYFGGFDQNRVLGPVSTQSGRYTGYIDLIDIGINVIGGISPWSFTSMSGLLAARNTSIGNTLPTMINPLAPYLHLPQSTCDAIAAYLPVTYQPQYGLYFWNTQDPLYERIVKSASCLSFTFERDQANNANITINVPFVLLNLTLQQPLTATPVSYFPCQAQSYGVYQLGRSFLQASFIGANWNANNNASSWWLAQAPGPHISSQNKVQSIGVTDTTIQPSGNDFADSWKGYWNITVGTQANTTATSASSSSSSSSSSASSGNSSSLSAGAKAGIGLGAAFAVIGAGLAGFLVRKHHRLSTKERNGEVAASQSASSNTPNRTIYDEDKTYPQLGPSELNGATGALHEMAASDIR